MALVILLLTTVRTDPPPKTLTISITGYINGNLSKNFQRYFQDHPEPPGVLIIRMNSPGGWSNDAELIGQALLSFERAGSIVIFIAEGRCTSGCFLISGYANQVIVMPGTCYGYGHGGPTFTTRDAPAVIIPYLPAGDQVTIAADQELGES